jgi:acetyl esterase
VSASPDAIARLHPQVAALLEDPAGADALPDLDTLRAMYAKTAQRLGGPTDDVAHAQDFRIPGPTPQGIGARYYLPVDPAPGAAGVLVWFHGGGWIMGDIPGIDPACRAICAASGQAVLVVDYRLAPEDPYPAGLEDAWIALQWACGPEGAEMLAIDEGRVAVGGDSAGGNLAAAVAQRARDAGLALHAQLLVYPALDPRRTGASHAEFAEGPFLTAADMELCWNLYVGGDAPARADEPGVSPLAGDLSGLAPAHIALAEIDPLRDDGAAYADALRAAGVPVTVEVHAGMAHGFLRWGGVVDESKVLLGHLAAVTRDRLS